MQREEHLYVSLLGKIEELARTLLEVRWKNLEDLWRIENDLINFQITSQQALIDNQSRQNEIKAQISILASSREAGWKERVHDLLPEG